MSSVNKAIIVGNVGKDPELRKTQGGDSVANFTMATTMKYKDKEATEWHRLVAFGKTADIAAEYVKKGSKLYIEGRLQTRKWTDKDNHDNYTTEIIVERLVMLGSKPEQTGAAPNNKAAGEEAPFDDGIPF